MDAFLTATEIIDWRHPAVFARARELTAGVDTVEAVVQICFEWVRDQIKHSVDAKLSIVTCSASEVLGAGSGLCYAKSHLLAALLRANHVPVGFCYQRLRVDDSRFCLHGFNSVFLPHVGWYRIDPRGNRDDVDTRFEPPVEHLAFHASLPGEATFDRVWYQPLPVVVETLHRQADGDALAIELPDFPVAVP